ncbi:hypothetical protein BST81_08170 [Leptolyngbya sp. 'hensonii']|uniref:two-partner secretion domain-containing protein n=1 Tax=Leptolyngbya sp. 'hensonii' TaxID=1922337 RepID=UPI00095010B6|nr:filamentous hemagglutinin N-terminal domain-containing protein [Leptolyngbya sp. 'hensonii']OLP18881.1 hypothetical protein BST81_08170 [Leptolyngbya sp. 'hensonii']
MPDSTLGPGQSSLTPNVILKGQPALRIDGGTLRGSNLFHSFSQFNVGDLERVYFANPADIQAIVTRVTGGNPSNILGTLGVAGPASLFLINPNGIYFGPNARLDITGSFVATTADRLKFADGSEFSATHPQAPPLLTVSIIPGMQFGSSAPMATIFNQGQLRTGQDLVLVAGTLRSQGQLQAGRDLILRSSDLLQVQNASLTVTSNGPTLGTITIESPANVLLDNTQITTNSTNHPQGGGDIVLTAANLLALNGSNLFTTTSGAGRSGDVRITTSQTTTFNSSRMTTETRSSGAGGLVIVNTQRLTLQNSSVWRAITFGSGPGGTLTIDAADSVNLSQSLLAVETRAGSGQGGDLAVTTPMLNVDGSRVTTTVLPDALGRGGDILVQANVINISGNFNLPPGPPSGLFAGTVGGPAPAGNIVIQPLAGYPTLTVNFLDSNDSISVAGGQGQGGNVILTAPEAVTIQGAGRINVSTGGPAPAGRLLISSGVVILDGVFLEANSSGSGSGGDILITGKSLLLSNGGRVFTVARNSGPAGNIELRLSDQVILSGTGTGLFAGTTPNSRGNSGNVIIDPQTVLIQDGAGIAVNSLGRGIGGNVAIQAGNLTLDRNAFISAETANSNGGNINLQINNVLLLRRNSTISATAGGTGDGGNVQITATFVVANPFENSDITANALFGKGGNLRITSQAVLGLKFGNQLTPFSDITASSEFGADGQVDLNTPNTDPQRGLVNLPVDLLDATQQIAQGCGSPGSQQSGRFVNAGRGGLPPSPADPLSRDLFWQDLQLYGLGDDPWLSGPPQPGGNGSPRIARIACSRSLARPSNQEGAP